MPKKNSTVTISDLFNPYKSSVIGTIDLSEINQVNVTSVLAAESYMRLPINLRLWLWFEQTQNPKNYDRDFFMPVEDSGMSAKYSPESRNVLALTAYRVPTSLLKRIAYRDTPFVNYFSDGEGYCLLLVHPSLKNDELFKAYGCTLSPRQFLFMPAASPRTGLTWEIGNEAQAFFTKLSYSTEGGRPSRKADLSAEGPFSVVKSSIALEHPTVNHPQFFSDEYAIEFDKSVTEIQKYFQTTYGVLFRRIPKDILSEQAVYIPFFALAATPANNTKPLLVRLIENSGLSVIDYFKTQIYPAVLKFMLDNSINGVYPDHLHGQNLLVKLAVDITAASGKVRLVKLEPDIKYRDSCDMKISAFIESPLLTKLRREAGWPEPLFTPGAYLHLAATDFIKRSIVPMLWVLEKWDGRLINHSEIVLPLFVEILNNLEKNINAPNSSQALYDYNTLYEFAAFLLTEVRLNQYTRRERQWLTHLNQITGYALDHAVITPERLDPKRFELLRAHLSQFIQDTQQRALELDQQPVSSGLYFTEPDVSFIREQREQVVERRIVMR